MAKKRKGQRGHRLVIRCAACREPVLLYQKDGPGGVLRMYLDRILAPESLAALRDSCDSKADLPNLTCPACDAVIGTPMLHAASGRLAFRVISGRMVRQKMTAGRQKTQPHDWPPE